MSGNSNDDAEPTIFSTPTAAESKFRRIGHYKLLQRIGEGGMGEVWMADQEVPIKRRVALKIVKVGTRTKQIVARFEAERQALALMNHSSIAKIFDGGTTDDGQPFLVMELVKGVPLTRYCDEHKLGLQDRLQIFIQICNAVQHAHQKGIIHRDLKPSNILVTEADSKPLAKVIDFGLAKALGNESKLTDKTLFTEFGNVVGTLQYMSPEQASLNALDIDTRSDIYALGVVLYELLTGTTPIPVESFRDQAVMAILESIREKDPPRPSDRLSSSKHSIAEISLRRKIDPSRLTQELRGELDWIVMKALDKDRNRRYETASGFAMDVDRYLTGQMVLARPPSKAYQLKKFMSKNRAPIIVGTAIVLLLVAGLFGTLFGLNSAITESKRARSAMKQAVDEAVLAEIARDETRKSEAQAIQSQKETERTLARVNLTLAEVRWKESRADEAIDYLESIPKEHRDIAWDFSYRQFQECDMTLYGHVGAVTGVCYDPRGKWIASSGLDKTIRIWDAVMGTQLNVLNAHTEGVESVEFNRDGTLLLSSGLDATLRIWDTKTWTEQFVLRAETPVFHASFSPKGALIGSCEADKVVVWDLSARNERYRFSIPTNRLVPDCAAFCFSQSGKSIHSWDGMNHSTVRLAEDGTGVDRVPVNRGYSTSFAAHPLNDQILIGATDGTAKLLDADLKQYSHFIGTHKGFVTTAQCSLDGELLATGGNDKTIRIWNGSNFVKKFSGHRDGITHLSFAPNYRRIASSSRDGTVKVWDIHSSGNHHSYVVKSRENPDPFKESYSEDETVTMVGISDRLQRFDVRNGQFIECNHQVDDVVIIRDAVSPHEQRIVYRAGKDHFMAKWRKGSINNWLYADSTPAFKLKTIRNHLSFMSRGVRCLEISDGQLLTYMHPYTEDLGSTRDRDKLLDIQGNSQFANFSEDKRLIVAKDDAGLSVWDAKSISIICKGIQGVEDCLDWDPESNYLVVIDAQHRFQMIDPNGNRKTIRFAGHGVKPHSFFWLNNLGRIITSSPEGARIWDSSNGEELRSISLDPSVDFCTWTHDQKLVLCSGVKEMLYVYDLSPSRSQAELLQRSNWQEKMSFDSSGKIVLFDDQNQSYRLNANEKSVTLVTEGTTALVEKRFPQLVENSRWLLQWRNGRIEVVDLGWCNSVPRVIGIDRSKKAEIKTDWHVERARKLSNNRNKLGELIHRAWALKGRPNDAWLYDDLQEAYSSYTTIPKSIPLAELPMEVGEALAMPRGHSILFAHSYSFVNPIFDRYYNTKLPSKDPISPKELDRLREFTEVFPMVRNYRVLAIAEFRSGNFEQAIEAGQLAITAEKNKEIPFTDLPSRASTHAVLSMASKQLGLNDDALKYRDELSAIMIKNKSTESPVKEKMEFFFNECEEFWTKDGASPKKPDAP